MLRGVRIERAEVSVGCCTLPSSPVCGEEWNTFKFHFHDFANLSTEEDHFVASPKFICNGHQWELCVFPGGDDGAAEGKVSAYLQHSSWERITARFDMKVIDKLGKAKVSVTSLKHYFRGGCLGGSWGLPNFISRSAILNESENILDNNGTLTVLVSIEEDPTSVFVPKNPIFEMMNEMFNDRTMADVCFEVNNDDKKEGEDKKVSFHAHRWILEKCAPMLAAICESNNDGGGVVIASVNDVTPDIFRQLLGYVYGCSIPEEELEAHAKDIIDAADKYSIVNLKLKAEAVYLNSTILTFANAMDNLLYADAKNCALLKEAVLDFLAENSTEAINNKEISFTDFPGSVVRDLMVAFGRSKKHTRKRVDIWGDSGSEDEENHDEDDYSVMRVSELRRKLNAKGLNVDGSREAMIEALNNSSEGLNHTAAEE